MMKQLYIIIFLCFSNLMYSQNKKIGIKVGTYGFFMPSSKNYSKNISNWNIYTTKEMGISYNFKKKSQFEINFSFWNNALKDRNTLKDITVRNSKAFDTLATLPFVRTKYKYFDLLYSRELISYHKNKVILSVGGTYARGNNAYLRKLVLSLDPNFIDIIYSEFKYLNENYFGIVSGLTYNYSLFNDTIRIGVNSNVRFYPKYPVHINYGLRLQCNI